MASEFKTASIMERVKYIMGRLRELNISIDYQDKVTLYFDSDTPDNLGYTFVSNDNYVYLPLEFNGNILIGFDWDNVEIGDRYSYNKGMFKHAMLLEDSMINALRHVVLELERIEEINKSKR